MKIQNMILALIVVCMVVPSAFADPNTAQSAAKKVSDEVVGAVTDQLVGKETVTTTEIEPATLPPGLAKKGKVPPGWAKKKSKVKKVVEKEPSLIEKWAERIFQKADPEKQQKAQELTTGSY